MTRHRHGFTLIELLVVITIIAILAAILLPSLRDAKEKVRRAKCVSNLRQIYIALMMYEQDWNRWPPNPNDPYVNWARTLSDGLGITGDQRKIFFCPSKENVYYYGGPPVGPDTPWPAWGPTRSDCYVGYNYLADHDWFRWYNKDINNNDVTWTKSIDVLRPSLNPLVVDVAVGLISQNRMRANHGGPNNFGYGPGFPAGANRLFCDGHVAWSNLNELYMVTDFFWY